MIQISDLEYQPSLDQRRAARRAAGAWSHCPVEVVAGADCPELVGRCD